MNRQLLTIMLCGIDLWVVLFVLERQPVSPWDISVVISNPDQPPRMTLADPVQVWLKPEGLGLWPDTGQSRPLAHVQAYLAHQAAEGKRVEVRLLCDPSLSLRHWGEVALALSPYAEEIRIAPLPDPH